MFQATGNRVPSFVLKVFTAHAIKLGINIVVNNPDDEADFYPPSARTSVLTVYLGKGAAAGPYSGGLDASMSSAFGVDLSIDQWSAMTPSLVSTHLKDEFDNVVAEVLDNTLYILFNVLPRGEEYDIIRTREVLDRIMQEFAKLPPLAKRKEETAKRIDQLKRNSRREFQRIFANDRTHNAHDIQSQFDFLTKMAKGDLIVTEGEVRVPLGRKKALDQHRSKRDKIDIGQIFFVVKPGEDVDESIKIFYLTPDKVDKHRYIYSGGDYCLGNIDTGVENFLQGYEVALAAEAIKLFVEVT